MWFSTPKYQKVLSNLSNHDSISALHALTDNFYCDKNSSAHGNEYYGLLHPEIDKVCGRGFSKLSQEEKLVAIKLISSNLKEK